MEKTSAPHRREYGGSSKTLGGETVKSRSEKQIADYFRANRINYSYEGQAKTTTSAFRTGISRPDFYLPDYGVYVEFWGLIDVGESEQRNKYREDMNWKMKQYVENGIKFISLYPWNLNDLDGSFRTEFKKAMGKDLITGVVGERVVFALPLSDDFESWLRNGVPEKLQLLELQLVYTPFFFVEYDSFTQGDFLDDRVKLTSHGLLALEGQKGLVVDVSVSSGIRPQLRQTGCFVDCSVKEQKEVLRSKITGKTAFAKFEAIPVKLSNSDAEKIAKIEIAKNLRQTFSRKLKDGSIRTKTLTPDEGNVRIVSVKLVNIPIVTAVFGYKDKVYRRSLQSTTNRIIYNNLAFCDNGRTHPGRKILLCEECGRLACENHGKLCYICQKALCVEHAKSKGLLAKKYYCRNHVPV